MKRNSPFILDLFRLGAHSIRVHLTFFCLVAAIWLERGVPLIFVILGSLAIHEIGHLVFARIAKLEVGDLVLYPSGFSYSGEISSDRRIHITFYAFGLIGSGTAIWFLSVLQAHSFGQPWDFYIRSGLLINRIIIAVNLIPFAASDGGAALGVLTHPAHADNKRGLPALLSRINEVCSLAGIGLALAFENYWALLILSIFFIEGLQDSIRERAKIIMGGYSVKDVMIDGSKVDVLVHGQTVSQALSITLRSLQPIFPVLYAREVIGVISRDQILSAAASQMEDSYLTEHITREFGSVKEDDNLATVLDKFDFKGLDSVLVIDEGRFRGLLLKEKLVELLVVNNLRKRLA